MLNQDDGPMGWITDISTPEGRAAWDANQHRIAAVLAKERAEYAKDPVAYDARFQRLRKMV